MLKSEGFAGSGHRNSINAKARKIQVLAQPAPENRQRARAARLIAVNGRERVPEVFAAAGLDLNENQFVLGVNGDQVELAADLFVFESGGRSPIPLQDAVAVRFQDAGGQLLAPCRRCGRGAGFAGAGFAEAGCSGAEVCWVRFGLRRGLLFGLLSWVSPPVDSGNASTVPAARVPEGG